MTIETTATQNKIIPVGNRWVHLQHWAGTFRNMGLGRDGVYCALKKFAATKLEDGANYPDEKLQALADAVSSTEWLGLWDGEILFPDQYSPERLAALEAAAWNEFARHDRRRAA
jgi:hypothetical protein